MACIKLSLPIPVSANNLYYNKVKAGGRGKTKKATDWIAEAKGWAFGAMLGNAWSDNIAERNEYWAFDGGGFDLKAMQAANPHVSYRVVYKYHFADERPRDIFNFEKLLSDFLVDMGFMLDDSFIDEGVVKRMPKDPENPRVDIEIYSIDKADGLV